MESQPQNPEFRINPENFQPCNQDLPLAYNFLWWWIRSRSKSISLSEWFHSKKKKKYALTVYLLVVSADNH